MNPHRRLTDKQSRFVSAYKEFGDPIKAAISAGYAAKSAHIEANRMLKRANIVSSLNEWRKEKVKEFSKQDFIDTALQSFRSLDITEPNSPRFLDLAGKGAGHIGSSEKGNITTNNVQINIDARQLPSNDKWNLLRNALEND